MNTGRINTLQGILDGLRTAQRLYDSMTAMEKSDLQPYFASIEPLCRNVKATVDALRRQPIAGETELTGASDVVPYPGGYMY